MRKQRRSSAPGFKIPSPWNPLTGQQAQMGRTGIVTRVAMMQVIEADTHDNYVVCKGFDPECGRFLNTVTVAKPYGRRGGRDYGVGQVLVCAKPLMTIGETPGVARDSIGHPADLDEIVDILYDDDDDPIAWLDVTGYGEKLRFVNKSGETMPSNAIFNGATYYFDTEIRAYKPSRLIDIYYFDDYFVNCTNSDVDNNASGVCCRLDTPQWVLWDGATGSYNNSFVGPMEDSWAVSISTPVTATKKPYLGYYFRKPYFVIKTAPAEGLAYVVRKEYLLHTTPLLCGWQNDAGVASGGSYTLVSNTEKNLGLCRGLPWDSYPKYDENSHFITAYGSKTNPAGETAIQAWIPGAYRVTACFQYTLSPDSGRFSNINTTPAGYAVLSPVAQGSSVTFKLIYYSVSASSQYEITAARTVESVNVAYQKRVVHVDTIINCAAGDYLTFHALPTDCSGVVYILSLFLHRLGDGFFKNPYTPGYAP